MAQLQISHFTAEQLGDKEYCIKRHHKDGNYDVIPFGAVFYSVRGDQKIAVIRAVDKMNAALVNGEFHAVILGARRRGVLRDSAEEYLVHLFYDAQSERIIEHLGTRYYRCYNQ